ncbi:hypothetical protein [Peribacillus loiseleuriae]|uniref:hypothetical protein n=1 Tax=Peribacillus loiseleuriae TaxID=1679170 RepID=UPI003D081EBE
MKKNLLLIVVLIFGGALSLYTLDKAKTKKLHTPPELLATVDGDKVAYQVRSFDRDGIIIVESKKEDPITKVNPRTKLLIDFAEEPESFIVSEIGNFGDEEDFIRTEDWNTFSFREYALGNSVGYKSYVIHAKWVNGKEATYSFKLDVKQLVSYQGLLPREHEKSALIILGKSGVSPVNFDENKYDLSPIHTMDADGKLPSGYPELKIESTPTYIIFDYTQEVFRTDDDEELIKYLESVQSKE